MLLSSFTAAAAAVAPSTKHNQPNFLLFSQQFPQKRPFSAGLSGKERRHSDLKHTTFPTLCDLLRTKQHFLVITIIIIIQQNARHRPTGGRHRPGHHLHPVHRLLRRRWQHDHLPPGARSAELPKRRLGGAATAGAL